MEKAVAMAAGKNLTDTVGTDQRDIRKIFAKKLEVAIIAAVEQRSSPDAREHQRKVRLFAMLARIAQQLMHFLLGRQWLADRPVESLSSLSIWARIS
jgi:hypothetical protein